MIADGTLYVGCGDDRLYARSPTDGSELWSFRTAGPVAGGPTVADGTVYIQSHDDYVHAIDIAD